MFSLLQSKLCGGVVDLSCNHFPLNSVNVETRRVRWKEHCKGFLVHIEGSVNQSVAFSMQVTCCLCTEKLLMNIHSISH